MTNEINKRIKKYRQEANITQREMAELLGLSYSAYSKLERNGVIRTQLLLDICCILKIDSDVFYKSGMMVEYEELQSKNEFLYVLK